MRPTAVATLLGALLVAAAAPTLADAPETVTGGRAGGGGWATFLLTTGGDDLTFEMRPCAPGTGSCHAPSTMQSIAGGAALLDLEGRTVVSGWEVDARVDTGAFARVRAGGEDVALGGHGCPCATTYASGFGAWTPLDVPAGTYRLVIWFAGEGMDGWRYRVTTAQVHAVADGPEAFFHGEWDLGGAVEAGAGAPTPPPFGAPVAATARAAGELEMDVAGDLVGVYEARYTAMALSLDAPEGLHACPCSFGADFTNLAQQGSSGAISTGQGRHVFHASGVQPGYHVTLTGADVRWAD